jgi:hypothetical protein
MKMALDDIRTPRKEMYSEERSLYLIAEALFEIHSEIVKSNKTQERIAVALESIANSEEKPKLSGIEVAFGKPTPISGDSTMAPDTGGVGVFEASTLDAVPYTISGVDQNENPIAFPSDAVLKLVDLDGNCAVVPNPSDPTGATGSIVANTGYSGPVNGTGSITDSEGDTETLTWSGTFDPVAAKLTNIVVTFGVGGPVSAKLKK